MWWRGKTSSLSIVVVVDLPEHVCLWEIGDGNQLKATPPLEVVSGDEKRGVERHLTGVNHLIGVSPRIDECEGFLHLG